MHCNLVWKCLYLVEAKKKLVYKSVASAHFFGISFVLLVLIVEAFLEVFYCVGQRCNTFAFNFEEVYKKFNRINESVLL